MVEKGEPGDDERLKVRQLLEDLSKPFRTRPVVDLLKTVRKTGIHPEIYSKFQIGHTSD